MVLKNSNSELFKTGDIVFCIYTLPLSGNTVAPPLELGEEYIVQEIIIDTMGNQHLDVGLESQYEYISSYDTGDMLNRGHKIHWCHPSRFTKIGSAYC